MRSSEGLCSSFAPFTACTLHPSTHARETVEIMSLLLPSVAICALSSYNWAICGGLSMSQITVSNQVLSSCFHSAHVFYNSQLHLRVVLSVEETNASSPTRLASPGIASPLFMLLKFCFRIWPWVLGWKGCSSPTFVWIVIHFGVLVPLSKCWHALLKWLIQ